jgi:hypothetical protein
MESSPSKKNGTEAEKKDVKKRTPRQKKIIPVKFDKEGFYMAWGLTIVCVGLGILLIWATKTAPDGNSETMALSTSQRIVRLLPQSTNHLVVKYFIAKSKEQK